MPIYDLSKPLEMVLYTFFESIGYERPKFRSIDAAASLKVYNQRAGYGHWNQKFRSIDAAASLKGMGTIQLPSYTH